MGKKVDFLEAKKKQESIEQIEQENKENEKTPLDELNELREDNLQRVEDLSDENLQRLVQNIALDVDGKAVIFNDENEAIIYATQLQKNHREIRFCKINPCYSMYIGKFYTVEPMVTSASGNFTDEQYKTSEDFVLVSSIILTAIIEIAKREKAKETAENEAKVEVETGSVEQPTT
jgi:hypothetical protein